MRTLTEVGDYSVRMLVPQQLIVVCRALASLLQLDFDVDAGWQIELHQRIHCLVSRIDDIDQPNVGANFKLIT